MYKFLLCIIGVIIVLSLVLIPYAIYKGSVTNNNCTLKGGELIRTSHGIKCVSLKEIV